jgi:hypothetical protein
MLAVLWVVGAMFVLSASGSAREVTISRSDLPAAVSRSLDAHYPGAAVRGITREVAGRRTLFEAEMAVETRRVDATFDDRGSLVEEESPITFEECPRPVRDVFAASPHHRGTLRSVERVLRPAESGNPRYELRVAEPPNTFEFVFDPDGRLIRGKRVTGKD